MKTQMTALIAFALMSSTAFASNPKVGNGELAVKIYQIAVSTSELCLNPTVVYSNDAPAYQDLVANPTLFNGNIASGNYACIVLTVSDQWKVKPTANDSLSCVSGTEYTYDMCTPDWGCQSTGLDGSTITGTYGEDKINIYMSTAATGNPDSILGIYQRPTVSGDNQHGYAMSNAFQVSGSVTSTLTIANVLSNAVATQTNHGVAGCSLVAAPHFQFQ